LIAPRQAAMVRRTVEQSCSSSSAFAMASICPRMRRMRLSSFFLSRTVWAVGVSQGNVWQSHVHNIPPLRYVQVNPNWEARFPARKAWRHVPYYVAYLLSEFDPPASQCDGSCTQEQA
jgi:hypothetical protein